MGNGCISYYTLIVEQKTTANAHFRHKVNTGMNCFVDSAYGFNLLQIYQNRLVRGQLKILQMDIMQAVNTEFHGRPGKILTTF